MRRCERRCGPRRSCREQGRPGSQITSRSAVEGEGLGGRRGASILATAPPLGVSPRSREESRKEPRTCASERRPDTPGRLTVPRSPVPRSRYPPHERSAGAPLERPTAGLTQDITATGNRRIDCSGLDARASMVRHHPGGGSAAAPWRGPGGDVSSPPPGTSLTPTVCALVGTASRWAGPLWMRTGYGRVNKTRLPRQARPFKRRSGPLHRSSIAKGGDDGCCRPARAG
jgi:hypothetical protein